VFAVGLSVVRVVCCFFVDAVGILDVALRFFLSTLERRVLDVPEAVNGMVLEGSIEASYKSMIN